MTIYKGTWDFFSTIFAFAFGEWNGMDRTDLTNLPYTTGVA